MPSWYINNTDIFDNKIFRNTIAEACRSLEEIPELEDEVLDTAFWCFDDDICREIECDILSLLGYIWENREEIGKI